MPSREITRPTSFIFTLMGDLVRYYGGEIWIGSLGRLMAEFGLSEAAVRQAVSRMSRQGWIGARKVGTRSYYAMTQRGSNRVDRVSPRIYLPPDAAWDGRWRMLVYTIPENKREGRDRLRKDLTVLGFAPLGTSLWISPRDVLDAAREAARASDCEGYVDLFLADSRGPKGDRELIASCWDLDRIAHVYREFIEAYQPRLAAIRAHPRSDSHAFVEREWVVHDYRRFIYLDPGLPLALLPTDWPAAHASRLFRDYYEAVKPQALRFFESIFVPAPDRPPLDTERPNPFDTLLDSVPTALDSVHAQV